jgi:predicted nucleotidyltransferase
LKPHSLKPEFPLDSTALEILYAVTAEAASTGIDCMIVGATARDILLTHVFGIPSRSATYDIDLAVAVENWDQFEQLKSRLSARKGFDACERMKQRLYYRCDENNDRDPGYPLDLVPFGGIARNTNEIVWPPDMQVTMNVAGYQEVLRAAEQVELEPGCIAKVASLSGLAILKLIAWSDRGSSNPKDAHDLYQVMTKYADAGNVDRLYGAEFMLLEAAGYDPEIAGACLLGKDTALLANETTYPQLMAILEQDYDRLALEMVKSIRHADDAQAKVDVRMRQLKAGMMMRAIGK